MGQSFTNYQVRSAHSRRMVISLCTLMERNLESIISKYFCKDDSHQKELIELVFGTERINLKSKYHIVIDLLKKKFKTSEDYKKEFEGLQTKFDEFARIRNPLPTMQTY